MQGSYGIDERDWWRGMAVRVAGEGGKSSTDLAQVQVAAKSGEFFAYVDTLGRSRDVSG